MKKPVPESSPYASVPRIFTTALAAFSKMSLTSRLIELVDGSSARVSVAQRKRARAKRERDIIPGDRFRRFGNRRSLTRLEPESRLITHWRTIEHVARGRGPVSVRAVFDSANEGRTGVARGGGIGKTPI